MLAPFTFPALRRHRQNAVALGAFALLLSPAAGSAQRIATQDFEAVDPGNYTYTATGSGGFFTPATAVFSRAYGVENNAANGTTTTTLNFSHVKFAGAANTLTFNSSVVRLLLDAGGLDETGAIQVNIAYNNASTYVPTLKIQGSSEKPAWTFTATGRATVQVDTPTPPLTTYSVTTTATGPNLIATGVDEAAGPATITIGFGSTITDVDVQIVLTASPNNEVLIDNVMISDYAPLPVELISLSAAPKPQGIAVNWTTASEKNSAAFEVQRSTSGGQFQTIATVPAQGNSAVAHTYATLDRAPLAGLAYYRLRQVDTDGTAAYSTVVTARWTSPTNLEVYPNPSTSTLYLSGVAGPVPYRLRNAQGQLLAAGAITGAAGLDTRPLPAGLYLLEITTPSGPVVRRFVRQ